MRDGSGHSARGFSIMKLSATFGGIGSVAISAVPILANTRSTSGNALRRSLDHPLHVDRLREAGAGNAERVQRDVAFVEARDELRAHARGEQHAQDHRDHRDGDHGQRVPQHEVERRPVGRARPLHQRGSPPPVPARSTKSATAAGTKVTDRTSAPSSATTTVNAIGWNIFPSTPVSVKIGMFTTATTMTLTRLGLSTSRVACEDGLEPFVPVEQPPEPVLLDRQPPQAVLDDDHRAVDDQAEVERAEAHQVGAHPVLDHAGDEQQHGERDHRRGDQRCAPVAEEDEQHGDHE